MKFELNKPIENQNIKPDVQNRNGEAWNRLLEIIEKAAAEKWETFSPSKELGYDLWQEITTLPKSIGQLKNVKTLSLSVHNLTRIPPEIGEMESLETFIPRINYDLHWFPYEITNCKKLKDSSVSTRALYGNYKFRSTFPSLLHNPVQYFDSPSKCSICRTQVVSANLNQFWLSKWVATDVVPLLVNVCSEECFTNIPEGAENYLSFPHKGGKDLLQPYKRF